ncbi:MAG: carbonic anhydrase [Gammaproteobacteria bacterium]
MDELIRGYLRFQTEQWSTRRADFESLARYGQAPHTLVIACCDSRVAPELIFDCQPGEMFVIRNIANLAPPYAPDTAHHGTSAALEFAIRVLKVRHLAVVGHSGCGGIAALMNGAPPNAPDFVESWVQIAEPAKRRAQLAHPHDAAQALRFCEYESIRVSLANLASFPWITTSPQLTIRGFHFDIGSGALHQILPHGLQEVSADTAP